MSPLRFIVEPIKLIVTWQPPEGTEHARTRRSIAEITPDEADANIWHFKYLLEGPDMRAALTCGFTGHPAFKLKGDDYTKEVRETFLRRLPPRNREDFADFLRMHRLPVPFQGSDLALLGYTQAKLPSDGFAVVPMLPDTGEPCEFILEVAGLRHVFSGDLGRVQVGDLVEFVREPDNPHDSGAVAVHHQGNKIGYVNRALLPVFTNWMKRHLVGKVERKNGTASRPLLFVRVSVDCASQVV